MSRIGKLPVTAEPKVSVGITHSKFLKVVRHFLKTPPTPHKEMKHKGGETVEQDQGPWDQSDPNCPSA